MKGKSGIIEKGRDYRFDIAKALLIILVILGHFFQQCIHNNENVSLSINWGYYFIYTFHMPAFMFVSGWFSCGKKDVDIKSYLKGTLLFLILPLLIWDCVIAGVDWLRGISIGINGFKTSLWYIKSLLIIRVIMLPFLYRPSYILGSIIFIIGIVIGRYFLLSLLIPSFLFGYIANKYQLLDNKWLKFSLTMLFIFELLYIHPDLDITSKPIVFEMEFLIHYLNRLLLGLSGAFIFVAYIMYIRVSSMKVLKEIGRVTLGIYILQSIIAERFFCPLSSRYNNFSIYILFTIITLITCYTIVVLIKKSRYSQNIIGK